MAVTGGEKEQSVHLLLPGEREESNEMQPLDRTDLRGNDGIFLGERSKRFIFGRPGGCHHGKFNGRGHTKFPTEFPGVQAESTDFQPEFRAESTEFRSRFEEFLPLPRERGFDHGFPGGNGRHGNGDGDGGEEKGEEKREKENGNIPFPTKGERRESFSYSFPVQVESAEFDSRVEEVLPLPKEKDLEHGFPGGEGRQPRHSDGHEEKEKREEEKRFNTE